MDSKYTYTNNCIYLYYSYRGIGDKTFCYFKFLKKISDNVYISTNDNSFYIVFTKKEHDGKLVCHNTKLPAIIGFFNDGNILSIHYAKQGNMHNLNGFAYLAVQHNSSYFSREYYIDGYRYDKINYFLEVAKRKYKG